MELKDKKTIITKDREETYLLGKEYGEKLVKGETILMYGEAGAGKTVFTKGLAVGLGIFDRVLSPTFAIRNDYEGKLPLHHLDMYRIEDESELYESGALEGIFDENHVAVIEWAENIEGFVNFPHTKIKIEYKGANEREITFTYFK